jgi:undecaprenyl diphosphate synthase
LLFLDSLWPDFDERAFEHALNEFALRDRRYGRVGLRRAARLSHA